jgi:hypothetical protein
MKNTELLDKNGKEIELNHIVKISGEFKHIFFFEGCFGFMMGVNSIARDDQKLKKYGIDAFVPISGARAKNMEVIGTWTGLKDKNGNLILKNDIVKINNRNFIISIKEKRRLSFKEVDNFYNVIETNLVMITIKSDTDIEIIKSNCGFLIAEDNN